MMGREGCFQASRLSFHWGRIVWEIFYPLRGCCGPLLCVSHKSLGINSSGQVVGSCWASPGVLNHDCIALSCQWITKLGIAFP